MISYRSVSRLPYAAMLVGIMMMLPGCPGLIPEYQAISWVHSSLSAFMDGQNSSVDTSLTDGSVILASEPGSWAKHSGNPVLPVGATGAWDSFQAGVRTVLHDNGLYKLWYYGHAGSLNQQVGLATSPNGHNWSKHPSNPVLGPGSSGAWDDADTRMPFVSRQEDGTYALWYDGSQGHFAWEIGHATSPDGVNWTKASGNPIFIPGSSGSWDDTSTGHSFLLDSGNGYRIWYAGWGPGGLTHSNIGYATSDSGTSWTRYSGNPVLRVGPNGSWDDKLMQSPWVLYDGNEYKMWYTGYDGNHAAIGVATSPDGISWSKSAANPVLERGASGTWEADGVGNPVVHFDGEIYRLWYQGGKKGPSVDQTGYATAPPIFRSSGTFISSIFDAGSTTDWAEISWNTSLPANTTLQIDVRTGRSSSVDATWTDWISVDNGDVLPHPDSRYIQFRALLETNDNSVSPKLEQVEILGRQR